MRIDFLILFFYEVDEIKMIANFFYLFQNRTGKMFEESCIFFIHFIMFKKILKLVTYVFLFLQQKQLNKFNGHQNLFVSTLNPSPHIKKFL